MHLVVYKLEWFNRVKNTADYAKIDKIMEREDGLRVGTNTAWFIPKGESKPKELEARILEAVKASNLTASKFTLFVGTIGNGAKREISL